MSRPHIPAELRRQVIEDAGYCCGYCLSDEVLMGVSLAFEHIIPIAKDGPTTRENLWRACRQCNESKGARTHVADPETDDVVSMFNPRTEEWADHFEWSEDYIHIVGITPTGRATVAALRLNRSLLVKARTRWRLTGWPPASDSSKTES